MTKDDLQADWWQGLLTGNNPKIPLRESRFVFSLLSSHNRCKFCNSPFDGTWAPLMRLIGRGPSRLTTQFCHQCQVVASQHIGGTEIELTLLFADVRGSTRLGEQMKPAEFSQLIGRFFSVSSKVLLDSHAWVDRLVGDQVIGMYIPYFTGPKPERTAVDAAKALLQATGHGDQNGPWIEVGVGIHSGTAFIGTIGSQDGATDITVLGDVPNVTARLSSSARTGEILVSEDTFAKTEIPLVPEKRLLELKGKSQPHPVYVIKLLAEPGRV
jgi:adenylate cyclase